MIDANFTSHVTVLLAIAARLREVGRGTIVVLVSGGSKAHARRTSSTAQPRPGSMPSAAGWLTRSTGPACECSWSGRASSLAG